MCQIERVSTPMCRCLVPVGCPPHTLCSHPIRCTAIRSMRASGRKTCHIDDDTNFGLQCVCVRANVCFGIVRQQVSAHASPLIRRACEWPQCLSSLSSFSSSAQRARAHSQHRCQGSANFRGPCALRAPLWTFRAAGAPKGTPFFEVQGVAANSGKTHLRSWHAPACVLGIQTRMFARVWWRVVVCFVADGTVTWIRRALVDRKYRRQRRRVVDSRRLCPSMQGSKVACALARA